MENKIKIPKESKIRVYWNDLPENYSKEIKNSIRKKFSTKYGVLLENIKVEYKPVKKNSKGELVTIDGATIDNILDNNYQIELFKEYLERENKEVDLDRLIKLDSRVVSELENKDNSSNNKKWSIGWLKLHNFLSFGNDNTLKFSNYNGLTVINSIPENTGGKTTLVVDSIKFLLFGKTTKTDKNEEIFNQFSDENDMSVEGLIHIEGEDDVIIERNLRRSPKRSGGWNIKNEVNYYRLLPDGERQLLNDEHAILTTKTITETVGTESDFELIVLATARNLDDLIDFSSTENSKLLGRFIGLEVLDEKEKISRKMYNDFSKKMKSNLYNIETLSEEIKNLKSLINDNKNTISINEKEIDNLNKVKLNLEEEKENLLNNKVKIDTEILTLTPSKLEEEIKIITEKGLDIKKLIDSLNKEIREIDKISFDEEKYRDLTKEISSLESSINLTKHKITENKKTIENLIEGGICQCCKRKLDDIDNSEHISEKEKETEVFKNELTKLESNLNNTNLELIEIEKIKKLVDNKNKLELERDKSEVKIKSYRNDIKSKQLDLKNYKSNLESIENNKRIDNQVGLLNTKINVQNHSIEKLNSDNNILKNTNETSEKDIKNKELLIENIKTEREVEKIYKIYIELVGKKGISKLVLRSVLPILNSEIQRLLEDVTEFDVEITINDKNEIKYLLVKDEIEKPLKSASGFERTSASLALRCVLGKMCKLSTPNFITLDEVLGRVAPNNIEKMKLLFDRVTDMYENIYFITQNEIVKDWANNIITVIKENNISKIK